MKKLLLLLILPVISGGIACYAQSQSAVVPGKLIVKFKPGAYEQAVQAQPAMRTQGVAATQPQPLQVGLASMDVLNREYNVTHMQRVFPYAGKHEARHQRHGLHLWYELTIDSSLDPVAVSVQYGRDAHIEYAEPAPVIAPTADPFPNDPRYAQQWHYHNTGQASGTPGVDIGLPQAWEKTTGDPRVIVAVVDGGVDYRHEDLTTNMWINAGEIPNDGIDNDGNGFIDDIYGFNFIDGAGLNPNRPSPYGPAPITPDDHGMHVAGTIAAATNNGIGVAGIAGGNGVNQGARIMSCQITDNTKPSAYIGTAIAYAADNGAVILQNSWELPSGYNESVYEAIRYFIRCAGTIDDACTVPAPGTPMKGGIVIFAAGNSNTSALSWPAAHEEVLAVAAVSNKGRRAYYSNYGNWVDISAPGGDYYNTGSEGGALPVESRTVLSTLPGNTYGWKQGTSMACPHVSGVAALVLSLFGSETYTPEMLRDRLLLTVTPLPNEPQYAAGNMGAGQVNAFGAVSDFVEVTGVTLPASHSVYVGRTETLHADIQPIDATNQRVQWTSSDPGIAAIDAKKGVVTGVAEGTVTVTATTADGGFTATTIVDVVPVLADSIRLAPQELILNNNATNAVTVLYYPADVTYKAVEWRSRNTGIAEVDTDGQITGRELGSAYIVAMIKDGTGEKDSCLVTVVQPVTGVDIVPAGNIRMVKGDTLTLHAAIRPDNAHNKTVAWSTSASKNVTVNNGLLTAKATGGAATITVRTDDGNFTAATRVEVYEAEHAPQGFSPNGDGINDYFVLTLDSRDSYALTVFDRSGQVHYRASNYQNDWDGTANTGAQSGKKLLPGTYYYSLTGNTSGNRKTGYVVIKY